MADRLASIYGTEQDKVNCPFYCKVGACRHGDRCSRQHNRPTFSQTLLLSHMYQGPPPTMTESGYQVDQEAEKAHFEEFYEEVFDELSNYGKVEELIVCENLGDHMLGNVYVKFHEEEEAEKALMALNGRFYAGRLIVAEYSPVTDFREARCRQFEEDTCARGGHCNFMHLKRPSKDLVRKLGLDRKREDDRARGGGGGGGGGGYRRRDDRGGGGGYDRDRYDGRGDRYRSGYGDRGGDDRYRGYDRGGDDRGRYDRGRGGDRGGYDNRDRGRYSPRRHSRSRSPVRESSAERRARIAEWNAARASNANSDSSRAPPQYSSYGGDDHHPPQ